MGLFEFVFIGFTGFVLYRFAIFKAQWQKSDTLRDSLSKHSSYFSQNGMANSLMLPMLGYYMFVHNSNGTMEDAMTSLAHTDYKNLQNQMDQMMADQNFLNQMNDLEMQEMLHNSPLATLPFEMGGNDLNWGNSFNDVMQGGAMDLSNMGGADMDWGNSFNDFDHGGSMDFNHFDNNNF